MLKTGAWRDEFVAIEVVACVGGCLSGGGESKSMDPAILEKRMYVMYEIDAQFARHRMLSPADADNLTVVTLVGERCRFDMQIEIADEDNQSKMIIRNLVREFFEKSPN
jgi:NADH-quinone oxidoreductase subunit G